MSVFEVLREQVSVHRILETGSGGKARCVAPDHHDTNPSMNLYGDHVHCFSCGFHGDVTDVWAAMQRFDRPVEAAIALAREFGVELPEADPEAYSKALERREKETSYLEEARACCRALDRHTRVLDWWAARGFGKGLREKYLLGANKDGTAAIIPFWHRGRI